MVSNKRSATGLVYATGQGKMCPECGNTIRACSCRAVSSTPQGDGIVRVSRATKGRKGSGVTLITGLPLDASRLRELAGQLKRQCGAGGAVKDGVLEIQGEHRDQVVTILQQLGYTVKRAGG